MNRLRLFSTLVVVCSVFFAQPVFAQRNEKTIDTSRGYCLTRDTAGNHFLNYPSVTGLKPAHLDSLLKQYDIHERSLRLHSPLGVFFNIRFVSDSVGFIYGYAVQYGYVNQVYRTNDGGLTWKEVFAVDGAKRKPLYSYYNVSLDPEDFWMFNSSRGIILDCFNAGAAVTDFTYLLTSDGGKTWERTVYKPGINKHYVDPVYTEMRSSQDGSVAVTLHLRRLELSRRGRAKAGSSLHQPVQLVIRSTDGGRSFSAIGGQTP